MSFSKRLSEAKTVMKVLDASNLPITSMVITPERVSISLKDNTQHPRLQGILRGERNDANGRWYMFECKMDTVLIRWAVARDRRRYR